MTRHKGVTTQRGTQRGDRRNVTDTVRLMDCAVLAEGYRPSDREEHPKFRDTYIPHDQPSRCPSVPQLAADKLFSLRAPGVGMGRVKQNVVPRASLLCGQRCP
jgi:hypothetical protein